MKDEILKGLNVNIIYPITDSPWVSLVHVVPKKVGITDEAFYAVVKTHKHRSNKIYNFKLTMKKI